MDYQNWYINSHCNIENFQSIRYTIPYGIDTAFNHYYGDIFYEANGNMWVYPRAISFHNYYKVLKSVFYISSYIRSRRYQHFRSEIIT